MFFTIFLKNTLKNKKFQHLFISVKIFLCNHKKITRHKFTSVYKKEKFKQFSLCFNLFNMKSIGL